MRALQPVPREPCRPPSPRVGQRNEGGSSDHAQVTPPASESRRPCRWARARRRAARRTDCEGRVCRRRHADRGGPDHPRQRDLSRGHHLRSRPARLCRAGVLRFRPASSYVNANTFESDGRWAATPADSAPFTTRIVVHRPTDARKFNGTVVVEWLNVSGGLDSAPQWISSHSELLRDGFAWVGVSAQRVGVEGGTTIVGQQSISLKLIDPVRYGSLHHPGDSFSYDIFSQVGQAIRHPAGADPLAGLKVKAVIGSGHSQSAARLTTYVNAIHPLTGV